METMPRNLLLLAASQAMMMTGTTLSLTTAALVGLALAPSAGMATVPLALMFLATMAATFPASYLMQARGRRLGFMVGTLLALCGAALCTLAVLRGSFPTFCFGILLIGAYNGFGQFHRFAAAEVAGESYRSRAISLVLAGGLVAAFLGPWLAAWAKEGLGRPFAGSFAVLLLVYAVALGVAAALRIPKPELHERRGPARPLKDIVAQPAYRVAVLGAMIGYGVMNLVMTATPLAMQVCGHSFNATAMVIQWHVVGMFAPSFFTGGLIRRFGELTVMLWGGLLLIACVLINLHGISQAHFVIALVLLGLGWNFLFIGATTLLTETYTPAEKAKAQALNDFLVFGTVTLTALSSGALQSAFGWAAVNLGVTPLVALSLAMTGWLWWRRAGVPASPGH